MSISERASKLRSLIFEHDVDYERDKKTIESLKQLTKTEVVEKLEIVTSEKSRKMLNILAFAENHKNQTGYQSSFSDLRQWKSGRVFD